MKLWRETHKGFRWEKERWAIVFVPDGPHYNIYRWAQYLCNFPTLQQAKDFCDG